MYSITQTIKPIGAKNMPFKRRYDFKMDKIGQIPKDKNRTENQLKYIFSYFFRFSISRIFLIKFREIPVKGGKRGKKQF